MSTNPDSQTKSNVSFTRLEYANDIHCEKDLKKGIVCKGGGCVYTDEQALLQISYDLQKLGSKYIMYFPGKGFSIGNVFYAVKNGLDEILGRVIRFVQGLGVKIWARMRGLRSLMDQSHIGYDWLNRSDFDSIGSWIIAETGNAPLCIMGEPQ